MRRIMIFSGTTEGRILSERLCAEGIGHFVSVVSSYAGELMHEDPHRTVCVGRLTADQMIGFLREKGFSSEDVIVDATHPYAVEATDNIRAAASTLGVELHRILRKSGDHNKDQVRLYADMAECARALKDLKGNILLTTGSKELESYVHACTDETVGRTYVRVLPAAQSLALCERCAIAPSHVIAMQGPFQTELNAALIRQYDIRHLVTKDSGPQGGFREKLDAAAQTGILVHVLARPCEETGKSIAEVWEILTGKSWESKGLHKVILAGIGMGHSQSCTQEVAEAIVDADIIFGAQRLIQDVPVERKFACYKAEDILSVLESEEDVQTAVILFSGDSGFYSGAARVRSAIIQRYPALDVYTLPGISSVSYLASRLGESYEDAAIESLHGRNKETDFARAAAAIACHAGTYILVSGMEDVNRLLMRLAGMKIEGEMFLAVDLSYPEEEIRRIELPYTEELSCASGLITLFIRNRAPLRRLLFPVLEDADFIRGDVPMTKACIRHESILKLALREGDLVYDIGGGTGSVAIEIASLHPSLKVCTIEKKEEACELIRENIDRHGLQNITLVHGEAVRVLEMMECPNAVFIGGSGGDLERILTVLRGKGTGIRIVLNAVSLETVTEMMRLLHTLEIRDAAITQLGVSEIRQVKEHHIPKTENPVTIFSFTL